VPESERRQRSKPEIALAEIDRLRAAGLRFSAVLADAGFGMSPAFRHGLDGRQLRWAVGIPRTQTLYRPGVRLRWPRARAGRPRTRPVPSAAPRSAEAMLARARWRRISWRQGTRGPLAARFAALRVRVADGPHTGAGRRLPGAELWLIGEWRASGERKYHLSNLPPRTSLRQLAAAIKARWVCEQAHQQLKQEIGLGDFEGRSWTGLHRHALMTCIAFAYLQHLRLKALRRRGEKVDPSRSFGGTAAPTQPASDTPRRRRPALRPSLPTKTLSTLRPQLAA
jgi:SRSO17 transposase